jgi:hypothetical protein
MTVRPSLQEAGRAFTDDPGVALTSFLRSRPSAPHLLGLGEAMHGEEAFPRLRNRMFRHLVEHEGYRSIALESSCLAGLTVDAFVAGGAGPPRRRHAARLQPRVRGVGCQPRPRRLDAGGKPGPAARRAAPVLRVRSPAPTVPGGR